MTPNADYVRQLCECGHFGEVHYLWVYDRNHWGRVLEDGRTPCSVITCECREYRPPPDGRSGP